MTQRTRWIGAALLAALVSVVAAGCGQSVATCDSDCALPDAPENCSAACSAAQTACATSCSGEFQEYLTCLDNAGTFRAVEDLCAQPAMSAHVGGSTLEPVVDGGTSPGDASLRDDTGTSSSSGGSCSTATCAEICSSATSEAAACTMGCESNQEACSAMAAQFQAVLTCLCEAGGLGGGGQAAEACAEDLQTLDAVCDPGALDAGTGR